MSVDVKQLQSACTALKKHIEQSEAAENGNNPLFEATPADAPAVYLCVQGRRYFSSKRGLKPHSVELPHSVWGAKKPSICLFSKDPQRQYKDLLQSDETKLVDRVVGVSKLKGKFKQYEARRTLKQTHDLFLAEREVLDMLPGLLGKSFYGQQRSVPVPVKIIKDGEPSLEQASKSISKVLNSTYFLKPASTLLNIRIGTTSQTPKELAANALRVIAYVQETFGEDIHGFRSLGLKTTVSPMLPFYYAEQLYDEEDVGSENEEKIESASKKRKREMAALDKLLAEVVDEDEIKEYNLEQRAKRKQHTKPVTKEDI